MQDQNILKRKKIRQGGYENKNKLGKSGASGAKWYDEECKEQSNLFREFQLRHFKTGSEQDRIDMCEQRSRYRKMCRDKKRVFEQKQADELVNLSKKKPKDFWKEIKGGNKNEGTGDCNF